jgi:hypothetical protein
MGPARRTKRFSKWCRGQTLPVDAADRKTQNMPLRMRRSLTPRRVEQRRLDGIHSQLASPCVCASAIALGMII